MIIHILCNDGSPLGVTLDDVFGESGRVGVGGAELALLTMCEAWTKAGHTVVLFNDPRGNGTSPFEQRPVESFQAGEKRDFLIIFRSPNSKVYRVEDPKIWWSCDQHTVGDFRHFAQFAQKIVTISPFHSEHFNIAYGIENTVSIDLPVRSWEYEPVKKVPNRLIFTSVPHRGLEIALKNFPRIKSEVPDASLVVTSDYRLWGQTSPLNDEFVRQAMSVDGVKFLGGVPRKRLVQEQLKAQIHFYPCIYDELFCIAVAESQIAGVLPITSDRGSLATTNMGVIIAGQPADQRCQDVFVETVVKYLQSPDLADVQLEVQKRATERFSIDAILKEWDERVFNAI